MGVSLVAFVLLSLIERLNSKSLSLFSFYFYIGIFFFGDFIFSLRNFGFLLDGFFVSFVNSISVAA